VNDGVKILVVDDHALVRGSLCERLQREPGFQVVAAAGTADEGIDKALKHKPDIVLMDIDMPGLSCFDAAKTITTLQPETKIIFLSAFFHDRYIQQALEVKARGYVTKREPPEAVVAAINEVASGGAYFSDEVRLRLVVDARGASLAEPSRSRMATLTSREVQILQYIARGLSKKEIASTMHLSVKTVDRHAANLMTKLEIHNRVELARFAIREGLAEA
jgi:DNA-binding NarL/FixJ family response regulator